MRHTLQILILASFGFFFSCSGEQKKITHEKDYHEFINPGWIYKSKDHTRLEFDLKFWNKRLMLPGSGLTSEIKVAGLLSKHFLYSGDIGELNKADNLYKKANQIQKKFSSAIYRSLATNDVTQHRFRQARFNLDSALQMGDDRNLTLLQKFDVELELGNVLLARQLLNEIANKRSFEFLVRDAKLKDHSGDLEAAIEDMEKALDEIKLLGNKKMYCWTMANLGDMYGHANRFEKSYQSYLKVLGEDPNYFHALKGIAWLAFSHDKNIKDAKRILYYLRKVHHVPDYDLMLAKIASFENKQAIKNKLLRNFVTVVSTHNYGGMYNTYLFDIYADEWNENDKALEIAHLEIENRPTPYSYHLLSWALFKSGRIQESGKIVEKYVLNKCFEPNVQLRLAIIFLKTGKKGEAMKCLRNATASSFELGPEVTSEIQRLSTFN